MTPEARPARSPARHRVAVYIGLTVVLLAVLVTVSLVLVGPPRDLVALVILCAMGLVSEALREPLMGLSSPQRAKRQAGPTVGFSFLSIILLACIPMVGPVGSALVGGVAYGLAFQKSPPRARVFNFAMNATCGAVGGLLYLAVGGQEIAGVTGTADLIIHVGLPLLVADAAQMFLNAALLAGIMRVDQGAPWRVVFVQMVSNSGVAYLGYGMIGFLFVVLWKPADVGPFSAVLILAPLFVARWAIVQYGDELRSHESALSALGSAVETKDPYAVGHGDRVARIVAWVAEPLSLSAQEVDALRFSAMLHDVGKVSLPTRIVRRPGEMTREDLLVLAEHPHRGVELLQGLSFLEGSLEGIRHHHERWDGKGYPDGLVGEQIPLASRIIAVADAFDSLTMPRPHRPAISVAAALDELAARAGTQFDPRVVEAYSRALERHDWEPGVVDDDTLAAMTGYFDHDDPHASDLYAALVVDRLDPDGPLPARVEAPDGADRRRTSVRVPGRDRRRARQVQDEAGAQPVAEHR